jgi:DNA-binding LacI/PurR family transcriptional regulator
MVRPTLDSVAAQAKVSRQTVSNVLNSPEMVRPATAERVREAIDLLGYRPSRVARQLRTRRSMTLGLRLEPERNGISGSVMDSFLHAVVEGAQQASYRVLLFSAAQDEAEIAAYSDLLQASGIDGFLLTGTHHGDPRTAWLAERGIPFATFGRPWSTAPAQHSWVDVDGAAGTEAAVRHLVALGHRRIGFIGWPDDSGSGVDRRDGWRRAVRSAGLAAEEALVRAVPDSVAAGAGAALDLLRRSDPPTAVVCASDSLAFGAMTCGEPLSVTGFDDTAVAGAVGLTSVTQPLSEAATVCLGMVLSAIESPQEPPRTVLLEPALNVRTSCSIPAPQNPDPPAAARQPRTRSTS